MTKATQGHRPNPSIHFATDGQQKLSLTDPCSPTAAHTPASHQQGERWQGALAVSRSHQYGAEEALTRTNL